jgi:hypothetical protein
VRKGADENKTTNIRKMRGNIRRKMLKKQEKAKVKKI